MFTTLLAALLTLGSAQAGATRDDCDTLDRYPEAWCFAGINSNSKCSTLPDPYEDFCKAWASKNDTSCEALDDADDAAGAEACEMLATRTRAKSDSSGMSALRSQGTRGADLAKWVYAAASLDAGNCAPIADTKLEDHCEFAVEGLLLARDGFPDDGATLTGASRQMSSDEVAKKRGEELAEKWPLERTLKDTGALKLFKAYLTRTRASENYDVYKAMSATFTDDQCEKAGASLALDDINITSELRLAWTRFLALTDDKSCDTQIADLNLSTRQLSRLRLTPTSTVGELPKITKAEMKTNLKDAYGRCRSEDAFLIWLGKNK